MKFLIIRFSSIGDIVLTTPVMRCLKKQVTGAKIHFLSKQSFKAVTEHNPYIDKFFYLKDNFDELVSLLKQEQYDYIIDLHKNIRSYKLRRALGVKNLAYNKESVQKFLLTKLHLNLMKNRHITLRSLDAVAPLGVHDDGLGLDYFIADKDVVSWDKLPPTHRQGFVGIVIGASFYTKKLPVHKMQQLCSTIKYPIILIGGPDDAAEGDAIAGTDRGKIMNACGTFNLNQSADLVRKARVIISHDTGLQYIACAFNKPVLAIWGGTSPKLDVEPYYGFQAAGEQSFTYKNFVVPALKCQPCSNFGTKKCPLGHFKCMELQPVNDIATLAMEQFEKHR